MPALASVTWKATLRRRADAVGGDRLPLTPAMSVMPEALRGEQALAAAVRADEQLDVEALFERLQPVDHEAGADIGLAGGERLDQRLAAGALVEQLNVEIVLGVDALGDAEAERRMAGRDFGPGEPDLRRRARRSPARRSWRPSDAAGRGDADRAGES